MVTARKHLVLTVPGLRVEGPGDRAFATCVGQQLKSWVAPFDTEPGDAYYGYTGPGYTEEFWIPRCARHAADDRGRGILGRIRNGRSRSEGDPRHHPHRAVSLLGAAR